MRFKFCLLRQPALDVIENFGGPACNNGTSISRTGVLIKELVCHVWITRFVLCMASVCCAQTAKLLVSPVNLELTDRQDASHIGQLSCDLKSGLLKKEEIFNSDETSFILHLHNKQTLSKNGGTEMKYANLVSGDDSMTLMIALGGGCGCHIKVPMIIFENVFRSYPIRELCDDIPSVTYSSTSKRFMDYALFFDWLNLKRIFSSLTNGRTRVLLVDDVSAHKLTKDVKAALQRSQTKLRSFPACTTDVVQPAELLVIQRFKCDWRARWDAELMGMVKEIIFTNAGSSERLKISEKRFFPKLAVDLSCCVV